MKSCWGLVLIVFIFTVWMCNTVSDEGSVTNPQGPDSEGYMTVSIGDITLRYQVEGDSLHCILSAQTSGWVAAGFNPSAGMRDANMIIGYVSGGTPAMRDDWGTLTTAHQSDTGLGGTDDVRVVQGDETGGTTEIEFYIPLDSGDAFDRVLAEGQSYPVLLAKGSSDSFTTQHLTRGRTTITL